MLDGRLCARCVNTVAYQQDWALRFPDQLRGLGYFRCTRALVYQSVPVRRRGVGDVELLQQHMRRVLDVGRARGAGHCAADRLVDDLVGLVGVLDRRAVLHRRREKWFLSDELDPTATNASFGDTRPLAADEDHW